jgi:putative ABC transport system permease protein
MVSIGTIVQQESIRQFKDMGVDVVTIRRGFGESAAVPFRADVIARLPQEKPLISEVAPYVNSGGDYYRGRAKITLEQMGVTAAFFSINKLAAAQGRLLSDLDANRYCCVVGANWPVFSGKTACPSRWAEGSRSTTRLHHRGRARPVR